MTKEYETGDRGRNDLVPHPEISTRTERSTRIRIRMEVESRDEHGHVCGGKRTRRIVAAIASQSLRGRGVHRRGRRASAILCTDPIETSPTYPLTSFEKLFICPISG